MSWNYRVVRREYKTNRGNIDYMFAIHEIYYDKNGKMWGVTEDGIAPQGETPNELKGDIAMMLEAFDKPVLNINDIPEEGAINPAEKDDDDN